MTKQFDTLFELTTFMEQQALLISGRSYYAILMPQTGAGHGKINLHAARGAVEQSALRAIVYAACRANHIQVVDYWKNVNRRFQPFLFCRQQVYQLLALRRWSTTAIGPEHGGKDHSSILHSLEQHHNDMTSVDYRESWNRTLEFYGRMNSPKISEILQISPISAPGPAQSAT